jgi:hypothetical protein
MAHTSPRVARDVLAESRFEIGSERFSTMKQSFQAGLLIMACFGMQAIAQDWYHDREGRFQGEQWRAHVFEDVRIDLDHIGSAIWERKGTYPPRQD